MHVVYPQTIRFHGILIVMQHAGLFRCELKTNHDTDKAEETND